MKRYLPLMMAAALLTATACDSDDDKTTNGPAQAVAGSYQGSLSASVQGQDFGNQEATVNLKAEGSNSVSIALPSFAYQGHAEIAATTLTGVSVAEADRGYTLMKVIATDSRTDTLRGTLVDKSLVLSYTLKPGAMPMPILFSFEGVRAE